MRLIFETKALLLTQLVHTMLNHWSMQIKLRQAQDIKISIYVRLCNWLINAQGKWPPHN